jgi:hypothetical protein
VIKIARAIKRGRLGFKDKGKPSSFIFLGGSGTGKCICGDTEIIVRNKINGEVNAIKIKNIIPDTE